MSGSSQGYSKAREKLYERYGGPEGLRKHLSEIGRKGGANMHHKGKRGFATMEHDDLVKIASKGGKANRKTSKSIDNTTE